MTDTTTDPTTDTITHLPCYMATACARTPSETRVAMADLPHLVEGVTCPDCLDRMAQADALPSRAPLVRSYKPWVY